MRAARIAAIALAVTPEKTRQPRILRAVLEPVPPIALGGAAGDRIFLSGAVWTSARVGWS
jgi:hypothetical protein